ncbi:FbpB family small basic protein [Halalkalibacter oceani]|uniref:FbpB family small basic protein n=1 Tax=Halalkalibacter oceani TaxID=1653776 RepID=A0A9X2IP45_9BACI|nr:FbpB family small basic protein [Halalkalibacter oceani]MCM3714471.1 FbpB family small basic protein [Halalkalibacter oceani]MCM3762445.1 FbpB family small basic protein [Halalkalibacter oceani]
MRRQVASFKELVSENKKELLNDPKALAEIEKRIDERSSQNNEKEFKKAQ